MCYHRAKIPLNQKKKTSIADKKVKVLQKVGPVYQHAFFHAVIGIRKNASSNGDEFFPLSVMCSFFLLVKFFFFILLNLALVFNPKSIHNLMILGKVKSSSNWFLYSENESIDKFRIMQNMSWSERTKNKNSDVNRKANAIILSPWNAFLSFHSTLIRTFAKHLISTSFAASY